MRGELETGTDCYILTPITSDHSSTSFAFWLDCSTVGHWGPKALSLQAVVILASCSQLQLELTQAVCGTWLYNCLSYTCFPWAYASATITEFNHVHRSRWYSDIFDRMPLFRCSSAYLQRCIPWLTARSRVNMLHGYFLDKPVYIYIYIYIYFIIKQIWWLYSRASQRLLHNSFYNEVLGRTLFFSLDCSILPLIHTLKCWVLSKAAWSTIFESLVWL